MASSIPSLTSDLDSSKISKESLMISLFPSTFANLFSICSNSLVSASMIYSLSLFSCFSFIFSNTTCSVSSISYYCCFSRMSWRVRFPSSNCFCKYFSYEMIFTSCLNFYWSGYFFSRIVSVSSNIWMVWFITPFYLI